MRGWGVGVCVRLGDWSRPTWCNEITLRTLYEADIAIFFVIILILPPYIFNWGFRLKYL